jgi:PIN domain nuclease of toxin-antitoxin system
LKLLLDTHALLWWLSGDARLGFDALNLIESDPETLVHVSIVSLWEIAVKRRTGKLDADLTEILQTVLETDIVLIGIEPRHLETLLTLPVHHRDPFDHLLMAQAIIDDMVFLSDDRHVPSYKVAFRTCGNP